MPSAPVALSDKANRTTEQPISYFMQMALETPGLISLAAGLVDEPSLPAEVVGAASRDLFADPAAARAALQYGTTQGLLPLRDELVKRLARNDGLTPAAMNLTAKDCVLSNGSQQLLYLLAETLLNPGDIVITEAPSYFVYHSALTSHGAQVWAVPMDDEGMRTDKLEELLVKLDRAGQLHKLKMVYTIDYFQNPTGLSLSPARRKELVRLVRKYSTQHRILILEDAAYRELRFEGDDVPSLKSLDPDNEFVIFTSTFSKPCAPGFKTGYGIMPPELVAPVLRIKGNHDFGSSNLNQHLLHRILASGAYDKHVAQLRDAYRRKRDAMVDALTATFREWPGIAWTRPAGGMYVWLSLPANIATGPNSPLIQAALKEGVLYIPGQFCHVFTEDGLPVNECRLCYGVATEAEIGEGVRRLARAVKALQSAPATPARVPVGV